MALGTLPYTCGLCLLHEIQQADDALGALVIVGDPPCRVVLGGSPAAETSRLPFPLNARSRERLVMLLAHACVRTPLSRHAHPCPFAE